MRRADRMRSGAYRNRPVSEGALDRRGLAIRHLRPAILSGITLFVLTTAAGTLAGARAGAHAGENAAFIEIRNTGPRLLQRVIEHRLPREGLFPGGPPPNVRVTETDASGKRMRDATGQIDPEGGGVVLSILLEGVTPTGARRYFLVERARQLQPDKLPPGDLRAFATDLRLDEAGGEIVVSNQFFTAYIAKKGRGGFPDKVVLGGSGNTYDSFFYGDRLYTKERGSLHLRDDPNSSARVAVRGPLRVVVETSARYGPASPKRASGDARAVYRYVYRAYSPAVDVTCRVSRTDDYHWREIHFLQLSRKDTLFSRWVGGDPVRKGALLNAKRSQSFPRWGVMHNADDAVGLGHGRGVILYDGIDYVNYLQSPVSQWTARTYESAGRLYFGPARKDPLRYAELLAGTHRVRVRRLPIPRAAAQPSIRAKYRVENEALSVEFAGEAAGLGLARLTDRLGKYDNVRSAEERPLLWRIELRCEDKALGPIRIDNRVGARCSASAGERRLDLRWDGIGLGDEPDALSVHVTVECPPGSSESTWRIKVRNRSARYGVWDVYFPVMSNVLDRELDVAVPRSNWGMLYEDCRSRQTGRYPSCNWPMQFVCVDRSGGGRAASGPSDVAASSGQRRRPDQARHRGLYLACHDPEAWPKRFSLTPSAEFHFQVHAPHQGARGAGYDQPFPIVVGTYSGDWWNGAKIYRRWAIEKAPWTRKGPLSTPTGARSRTPRKLTDLGLWMLGGGHAKDVVPRMHEAAKLFEVPIGIHWYNWHEIPFDTYYPDYFPTKPGFAEAVRELTAAGMVVMPYINGRLWDSGNENFKGALPFACKDTKGEPYIETYGSKRPLAVMCPATAFWQDRVNEICRRLMTECGVNAIYIDQIAAAGPRLCYDRSHGHPVGGGSWWVDGYRKMLTRISKAAHSDGRDVIITTENNTECYMDNVDAFLTWNPRYDNEIPMMTAVYSGYTTYFSSPSDVNDSLTAFAASQGRDFLFGCQLGWMGWALLDPQNSAKAGYLRELAKHRLAAARFMVRGELLGELEPASPVPNVELTWGRRRPHKAILPAVMATVWRAPDGQVAIAMTNWDDQPHVFRYEFVAAVWGLGQGWEDPTHLLYTRLTPRGPVHAGYAPSERIPPGDAAFATLRSSSLPSTSARHELLGPREVRVLAVRPAPSPAVILGELAEQSTAFLVDARPPRLRGSTAGRCEKLYSHFFGAEAEDEGLARAGNRCIAEILAAERGLAVASCEAGHEGLAPVGYPVEVRVDLRSYGRRPIAVECGLGDVLLPAEVPPGGRRVLRLKVAAPTLGEGRTSRREARRLRITFPDRRPCSLEIPIGLEVVRPFTVDLEVLGSPRAGEEHLVRTAVTNRTPTTGSPTLVLQAPADWEVVPGRQVRLPTMKPGEKRVVTFLCSVPRDAIPGRTRVTASVVQGGATEHIDVKPPRPRAEAKHRNGAPEIDGNLADWRGAYLTSPVVVDGGRHVRIEGWKGPSDCSARVWTGWDARYFFIAAEVKDDAFEQKQRGSTIWQGDCIQMAVCPGRPRGEPGYEGVVEFGLALTPDGPQVWQWIPEAREVERAKLVVSVDDKSIVYEAAIPWASLGLGPAFPGSSVGWSFTVNDADATLRSSSLRSTSGEGFRGWLEWTPGICGGKDASAFGRLDFVPE